MGEISEILSSKMKPKEKVAHMAERIKADKKHFRELVEILKTGSDVDKGTCADVMKHVTKDNPEIALPYVDDIIAYINYKAPRVRWGIPESIGNMAQMYPKDIEKAVPKLWINTKDDSTVVRWCAAFALCEIAKYNEDLRNILRKKFEKTIKQEKNSGVRNVYLRALKFMGRSTFFKKF